MNNRLSKRVKWIRGVRRKYWLNHVLNRTIAMLFGCVKSGNVSFCSIECARHNGCEPTRFFLNGEQIGEVCAGCGVELDTGEPSHSVE